MPLLIVESPAKAKTIAGYLGAGWVVRASYGHIRDLPPKEIAIEVDPASRTVAMAYKPLAEKAKAIAMLKEAAKTAGDIYLATDLDREGEAISWHLCHILGIDPHRAKRITFSEITKTAISAAVANPRPLNLDLVDAQQARRAIDRLVGYTLSPLLSGWMGAGLSAGRVQSAGLAVIVRREREIRNFVPVDYHVIGATVDVGAAEGISERKFRARLVGRAEGAGGRQFEPLDKLAWRDERDAQAVVAALEAASAAGKVQLGVVEKDEATRNPSAPFTTSTLQQEASRKLGFGAKLTMDLAQELYQGQPIEGEGQVGLITYMRTDSVALSDEAVAAIRDHILTQWGADYLPAKPRTYSTSAKGAQEAHEAIRPTSVARTPDIVRRSLANQKNGKEMADLYELIWKRAVACQMAAAVYDTVRIETWAESNWVPTTDERVAAEEQGQKAGGGAAVWQLETKGRTLRFDGFLAVYAEDEDEEDTQDDDPEDQTLPPVNQGEAARLEDIAAKKTQTKPPARFTEASLIKYLERAGVGRPSTYAQIIATLYARNYMVSERKKLVPTKLGERVVEALEKYFPDIVDLEFTARMEETLDDVARGDADWEDVVCDWWVPYSQNLQARQAEVPRGALMEKADTPCPQCGKELVARQWKSGEVWACTGYPDCRYVRPANIEYLDETCPECGEGRLCERQGKGRKKFIVCERRPECPYLRNKSDKPVAGAEPCPECGKGRRMRKKGKYGAYVGCERWWECKWIDRGPAPESTGETCPECGEGELLGRTTKTGKKFYGCSRYPDCKFARWPEDKTGEKCPDCGEGDLINRTSKKGNPFIACNRWPDCKYTRWPDDGRPAPKPTGETCPKCEEGNLVERVSRKGTTFVGCDRYPGCDYIKSDRPPAEKISTGVLCPQCGQDSLMVRQGPSGVFYGCGAYPNCKYTTDQDPRQTSSQGEAT